MQLFDAHCHLQDEALLGRIDRVLARAAERGVCAMLSCGTGAGDWGALAALACRHPQVLPAFGVHPWHVDQQPADWREQLQRLLLAHPRAAVGEIGLDHVIDHPALEAQAAAFQAQLELAVRLERPVVIHCRRAWGALLEALDRAGPLPRGFMVHSYSGAADMIEPLVRRGGCFSFSGAVTRSHNRRAHRSVPCVPLDRLLIETDAPDLTPSFPGGDETPEWAQTGVNEPASLPQVAATVAALLGVPVDEIADLTTANARRLFGIPDASAFVSGNETPIPNPETP